MIQKVVLSNVSQHRPGKQIGQGVIHMPQEILADDIQGWPTYLIAKDEGLRRPDEFPVVQFYLPNPFFQILFTQHVPFQWLQEKISWPLYF